MSTSLEATVKEEVPPEEWRRALHERLALATPQHTARGLFFTSALKSIRALGSAAALERCREVLGDQQFVPFFNYPIALLLRLTVTAAGELSAQYGSEQAAMRALGRQGAAEFLGSAVGNAVRVLAGGDIKQLLGSVQTIYRMGTSCGERWVTWDGPRSGSLFIRNSFMPMPYHEGVLEVLIERQGVKIVKVHGRQVALLDSTYEFSWE